ncbi:MAG: hypothetical protein HYW26_05410 [Candidatus Aenigmarchaeota archaeon]|nr:hypothetical protein [Candidatus Aenigmarchaeota archaeon]
MAKKKEWNAALIFGAGMLAMLMLLTAWNYATAPRYPNAYMMPMARMMMGSARSVDCGSLTENDLEIIGDSMMGQMIGDEQLHEQMDAQMRDERVMHILMAKMMTGCR